MGVVLNDKRRLRTARKGYERLRMVVNGEERDFRNGDER